MPSINIDLSPEQYDALCKGESITINKPEASESKQWEPQSGVYAITSGGEVEANPVSPKRRDFGTLRSTKSRALKARDEMRRFNRLLAYRDEFDPDYVVDWGSRKNHYYVYYDHARKVWETASRTTCDAVGIVYMSQNVAEDLAKKLNDGEVVL